MPIRPWRVHDGYVNFEIHTLKHRKWKHFEFPTISFAISFSISQPISNNGNGTICPGHGNRYFTRGTFGSIWCRIASNKYEIERAPRDLSIRTNGHRHKNLDTLEMELFPWKWNISGADHFHYFSRSVVELASTDKTTPRYGGFFVEHGFAGRPIA